MHTRTDWLTRAILGLVMTAALAVGTWSVYTLLREMLHAPKEVAIFGCLMFDGAAFFFARLSQRYATTVDSGLAPRTAMLAMICTSSWINWRHADLKGWGILGSVILGASPIVAELAFEMWHRYEHREALRRRGRVAEALPVLGKWAWLLHPARARRVVDSHVQARLAEVESVAVRRAAAAADAERITVERADAPPHHPHHPDAPHASREAQHVVITVQQAPALPAAAAPRHAPDTGDAPRDAPGESAGHPAHVLPPVPAAASADTLRLNGLSKADAVLRIREADPDASAPQIVERLAHHGITATPGYVRTVTSRAKKRGETGRGFYP